MTFDFSTPNKVKESMDDYIDKVLEGFPEETFEIAPTPAAAHLFKIRNENKRKILPEKQGSMHHHIVAKLLFMAFKVYPDIQTAVAFLTTCVKAPDTIDWGKIKRVMKYLKEKRAKITLQAETLNIIKW